MLAKALARESGCYFLNITASAILSKWLGDANRLIRAIFTLADKLQPCIIFIDEVGASPMRRCSWFNVDVPWSVVCSHARRLTISEHWPGR